MKKYYLIVFLLSIVAIYSQTNHPFLIGEWEIVKVDVGDVSIDNSHESVSSSYSNKLKGNPDSVLITNLLLGSIKNLIGIVYTFDIHNKLSQFYPKSRNIKEFTYKHVNNSIIFNSNEGNEKYTILSLKEQEMLLKYSLSKDTEAIIYLKKPKIDE